MQHDKMNMIVGIPKKGDVNPETTRFKRENNINHSAQVTERFLYRGLFCWQSPSSDINEQFLRMERSTEYSNRYSQLFGDYCSKLFAGTFATRLHSAVLNYLYKGKDPIKREPVVLSRMIQDHSDLLARLPEDTYSRNALSGSGQGITTNVRDEFWQHWSSYFDLPQSGYRPEPLVKSCGIKPVELKYDI